MLDGRFVRTGEVAGEARGRAVSSSNTVSNLPRRLPVMVTVAQWLEHRMWAGVRVQSRHHLNLPRESDSRGAANEDRASSGFVARGV